MLAYAARRLAGVIPMMFVIITLSFFLMRIAPAGPFDEDRALPPQIEANILAAYHLDEPLVKQYGRYVWGILHGDFGPSYKYRDFTVRQLIAAGFPVSLALGSMAILLALVFGISLGTVAALRQNGILDHGVMALAMTGIAIPNFVMAPLLTLILGIYFNLLPVGGWGTPAHAVLPVIALGLPQVAYVARLTRGSMIEVLRSNYIRTARAKGMPTRIIIFRHATKAALIPVLSYVGPATAALISGSVVIEQIFGIPGIGRYFVQGALNRDYTLVMGVVIFYGGLIMMLNLIVDLLYAYLDPKVRYD
jgi:oligopeptide transport system permease protein